MNPEIFHVAFYRFVRIVDVPPIALVLRELTRGLTGLILLAGEGINGMLAGDRAALAEFEQAFACDPRLHGLFHGMSLRRSACRTPPFRRMTVHERAEILPLGVAGVNAVGRRGRQLDPRQWSRLLQDPDVFVLDNRNSFEYRLGHFKGAIDPRVGNFRDLPRYVERHAPQWQRTGQRVAMYCTGGIRCEKTAAWMADAHGIEVLQLEGGILRYLAETGSASAETRTDWVGECFVFDNRIALDACLRETGTTAEQVYSDAADEAWRLQRARRLDGAA